MIYSEVPSVVQRTGSRMDGRKHHHQRMPRNDRLDPARQRRLNARVGLDGAAPHGAATVQQTRKLLRILRSVNAVQIEQLMLHGGVVCSVFLAR